MRRPLGALAAVLAMALIVLTQSSAAQLSLTGGQRPHVSEHARCDAAVDTTTPSTSGTSTSVTVSGVAAACAGLALTVRVYDPTTGTTRTSGSATVQAGGGTQTVTVSPAYSPSAADKVYLTLDSWPVAATWTYTPALPAYWCTVVSGGSTGATCTVAVTLFTGVKPGGSGVADYYDVVVQTTSTTALRWEVTFNLPHSFYGGVPTTLGNSGLDAFNDGGTYWDGSPNNDVVRQGTCSAGQLDVQGESAGPTNNNFRDLRNTRVRKFSLVVDQGAVGYNDVLTAGCP